MNNNKNSILLVDPEFDPNLATNCNLLLKITLDSFSFAIADKSSNRLNVVFDQQECADVVQDLALKFKSDPYLSSSFKEIRVAVYTENSIMVPDALYDAERLDDYSNFFTTDFSGKIYAQSIVNFGFTSIFTLQKFIDETLNIHLTECKKYDQNAPILALAKKTSGNALILDFTAGSFNALFVEHEKVIFQNSWSIENAEEFNYYLLLILKQLPINSAGMPVCVSGIIDKNDDNFMILRKYFNSVEFITPANENLNQIILESMPSHYYSSLLALDLCE